MSKSSKEYFRLCEADDWQAEQSRDPDYEVVSIDYSTKSWAQFDADLKDPSSELVKELSKLGLPPF